MCGKLLLEYSSAQQIKKKQKLQRMKIRMMTVDKWECIPVWYIFIPQSLSVSQFISYLERDFIIGTEQSWTKQISFKLELLEYIHGHKIKQKLNCFTVPN